MSTPQQRGPGRTTLAALAAAALLTGSVVAAGPGVAATDASRPTPVKGLAKGAAKDKLGAADRTKLAKARAKGEDTVTAMVVVKPSATKRLAKDVEAAGGYIRMTDRRLGYVSAVVPTDQLQKVVVADADVEAVDLDEVVRIPRTSIASNGAATGAYSGPDASTPDSNPYMPTKDTGSVAFKAQHKLWDGRGVTIGILDSGIDLDNPALRTTSTGEEKVVDWFTATDPVTEGGLITNGDPTWLPMTASATGPSYVYEVKSGGQVVHSATYSLPEGSYKFAALN